MFEKLNEASIFYNRYEKSPSFSTISSKINQLVCVFKKKNPLFEGFLYHKKVRPSWEFSLRRKKKRLESHQNQAKVHEVHKMFNKLFTLLKQPLLSILKSVSKRYAVFLASVCEQGSREFI